MLLTIVVIWAIVIPVLVLGISWQIARLREADAAHTTRRSVPVLRSGRSRTLGVPRCAIPAARPGRTITRRVCPELPRGVGRRSTSA
jgi:hypothetical protein